MKRSQCSAIEAPPFKDFQEPTEELVHVHLRVITKGIEVNKGMLGQDSALKCFEV